MRLRHRRSFLWPWLFILFLFLYRRNHHNRKFIAAIRAVFKRDGQGLGDLLLKFPGLDKSIWNEAVTVRRHLYGRPKLFSPAIAVVLELRCVDFKADNLCFLLKDFHTHLPCLLASLFMALNSFLAALLHSPWVNARLTLNVASDRKST